MFKRPLGAEDEKIAEWDKKLGPMNELARYGPTHGRVARESAYVGCWLEERLREREASEPDVYDTCMASGQICFGRSDPWIVARIMLHDFDKGVKYKPGRELAASLTSGKLSAHFGPGGELRTPADLLRTLGVTNMEELLKRFGAKTLEELKEKLEAKLSEQDREIQKPR